MDSKKYIEHCQMNICRNYAEGQKGQQYSKLTLRNKKTPIDKNHLGGGKSIQSPCTPSDKQRSKKKSSEKSEHKKSSYLHIYESKLMQTEHSSLSHSTYKTKAVNLDLRKQKNKTAINHFNSLRHQTSESKSNHKSSTMIFNASDKSTVKLQLSKNKSELQAIFKRTKSVLDSWSRQKSGWLTEKKSYQLKISQLHREIANLKSKVNYQ